MKLSNIFPFPGASILQHVRLLQCRLIVLSFFEQISDPVLFENILFIITFFHFIIKFSFNDASSVLLGDVRSFSVFGFDSRAVRISL